MPTPEETASGSRPRLPLTSNRARCRRGGLGFVVYQGCTRTELDLACASRYKADLPFRGQFNEEHCLTHTTKNFGPAGFTLAANVFGLENGLHFIGFESASYGLWILAFLEAWALKLKEPCGAA